MEWTRYLEGDEFGAPSHAHRADALALVTRTVAEGATGFVVSPGSDRRAINGAIGALRALVAEGLASVRPNADGRSAEALLTLEGRRLAVRARSGGVVLFPSHARIRIVDAPPEASGGDLAAHSGPVLLPIAAPEWFDADVRAGSEAPVLLDPVQDWLSHPVYEARHHRSRIAIRAWEVFDLEGESHGLLLETADGFHGVELGGPGCSAPTPEATAWEIVINK